jgi:hypothetical protein
MDINFFCLYFIYILRSLPQIPRPKEAKMIYYENGIKNTEKDAEKGGAFLSKIIGFSEEEVGIINNKTHGLLPDLIEYKNPLDRKDILNAYAYEKISQNGEHNLIVMFSAGNKDALKAMEVLKLENRSLGGKVDFLSVGSPIGKKELTKAAEKVGANIIGQYNDWKDPVTNPKTWIAGIAVLGIGGAVAGAVTGVGAVPVLTAKTSLEAFFNTVITGAAAGVGAGVVGKYNLTKYHSFESYLDRNVKEVDSKEGVQDSLRKWKEKYVKNP